MPNLRVVTKAGLASILVTLLFHSIAAPILAEEAKSVSNQFIIKFANQVSNNSAFMMSYNLGLDIRASNDLSDSKLAVGELDHQYAKDLIAAGVVEYIEPNYIYTIDVGSTALPDDQFFSELWGLNNTQVDIDIDAPDAWSITTGSDDIVVGVVDTGIEHTHPDLQANMWINGGEIAANGIDDDGNGVIDDVHGFNSISGNGDALDDNGHGTHCAGTIGASGDNSIGITGVAWNVKLMSLKFLDEFGSGTTQDAIEALEYAVAMKQSGVNLRVLSNSWGGPGYSQALEETIEAVQAAGILFVAAAGNSALDVDFSAEYPAAYDNNAILSVAAVDQNGNLASFSNYGVEAVDLAAPGVSIYSTFLNANYSSLNGTSMATPHVSGVAALLLAHEPLLSTVSLKERLTTTVRPLSSLNGLVKFPGMVNAGRALTNTLAPDLPTEPEEFYGQTSIPINFSPDVGEKITSADDGYVEVVLPFSFPFFGDEYSRLAISSNGRIIPLAVGQALTSEADYANRVTAGILPYHDDLFPSPFYVDGVSGGVWAKANTDSVVITWASVNYANRNSTNLGTDLKFQAKLFANGNIEFHYLDTDAASSSLNFGASATIAIQPIYASSGKGQVLGHNQANSDLYGNQRAVRFGVLSKEAMKNDFDGDGLSDLVVWRPSNGFWFILPSSSNFNMANAWAYQHGLPGDIPLTGDFDGDSAADMVVWRPSNGTWYFRKSGSNHSQVEAIQWGLNGDVPLTGDFDGDGKTDVAVFRGSNGVFYSLLSSGGFDRDSALTGSSFHTLTVQLGNWQYDPLVGDTNGDGADDFISVWQPQKIWTAKDSAGNLLNSLAWGTPGDEALSCDWDNDGINDSVIARDNYDTWLKEWYVVSSTGAVFMDQYGIVGDQVRCQGDFDADGRNDVYVWRPSDGNWFIKGSAGTERMIQFGLPEDVPL